MKTRAKLLCALVAATLPAAPLFAEPDNPNIDMPGYLQLAAEAAAHRQTHRVTEDEFIRLSREPGTIILDARNAKEFQQMHVQGAINVSFAEIDLASLKEKVPDKNTLVLIYCNNNFADYRLTRAPRAALNLTTYIALYGYGYRNVYELAPYLDINETKLNLVGLKFSDAVNWLRTHRPSEEEFLRLSQEPGTIILDASTWETYRWLHLTGAKHLPRREMNTESLARMFPDKNVRILLYENNNYQAFINQRGPAGITNEPGVPPVGDWSGDVVRTCQLLREHGYHNVYALAAYVRVDRSSLPSVTGMSAVDLEKPVSLSLHQEAR